MTAPKLLARSTGDAAYDLRPRAATTHAASASVPYCTGAVGEATVTLFSSGDDEDRGGFVLRLAIDDQGSSFLPSAEHSATGVDLHLAGEAEAAALLAALSAVLAAEQAARNVKGVGT